MPRQCLVAFVAGACVALAPVLAAESSATADPALSAWIGEVLAHNPELQAARDAYEAAAGRVRAAERPLFNPELEFGYESGDTDTATGGVSQTLDWSGKRAARAAVAGFAREGTGAELRARRQDLATDLLRALAEWHTADAVARLSGRQATLMSRFARLAERRRQAGDLGQVELDLTHLAAAEAAFRQADAAEALIRAQRAVTALAGSAAPDWPAFDGQLPDIDPGQLDAERLLNELPALLAAQAHVAAARASVRRAQRERTPDPSLGVRVGREDSATLTGFTLSVPLFVRNTFGAEVDVAGAELSRAGHEADSLRRQARAELVAAARLYRNARDAWLAWEAAGGPRLDQRTELLDRLWQAGELDTTDYLVQLKQVLDTEAGAIEQRGRMWRAWADWLAASGQAGQWLNLAGDWQ